MSSIARSEKRKPLSIPALLVIAALASGACTFAIPAPHQPPGGFANAASPGDPGMDPDALPSFTHVVGHLGHGVGEVATAIVSDTHR